MTEKTALMYNTYEQIVLFFFLSFLGGVLGGVPHFCIDRIKGQQYNICV